MAAGFLFSVKYMEQQDQKQLALDLTDEGIRRAADHAEDVSPGWSETAYKALQQFIQSGNIEFTTEKLRMTVNVPEPPSRKAWGSVIRRAMKSGLIIRVGYSIAEDPMCHCGYKAIWRATS